jgi:hypothetical protein
MNESRVRFILSPVNVGVGEHPRVVHPAALDHFGRHVQELDRTLGAGDLPGKRRTPLHRAQ